MLVELSITPLTGDSHISEEIAGILDIIDDADVPYPLTPTGTCLEGEWDEVMPVIRPCHEQAPEYAPHVITDLKIEDEAGAKNQLEENISSVQEKLG